MSAKGTRDSKSGLQREAPRVVMVVAVVLLVLAVGAGGYYAINGGWKTASQQDDDYKHNLLPILAAKHGDKGPLEAENKLRKEHGQPPLELPKDTPQQGGNTRDKVLELQKQIMDRQGKQPGQ